MDKYIQIQNCNCISSATIKIIENALNIKYGANGTGKSTISETIFAASKGDNNRLDNLKPYGSGEDVKPHVSNEYFHTVKVFDENYVNSYLFKGDEFLNDSFQVFLRSEECDELVLQIENSLTELQDLIIASNEIQNLRSFLPKYIEAVHVSDGKASRRGGVSDFVNGNGGGFDNHAELALYKPFYSRDMTTVSKWAKWRNDGSKQMYGDTCPFCTHTLPSNIQNQNVIISRVFKNSALSVANAVLDYLQQAIEHGYIESESVDTLKSYIGDTTRADELYSELQTLAKETEYLDQKIERICSFKPMNVTHDQLVNLETSLSELIIDERQLSIFYTTDLIKELIRNVTEKVSTLKSSTGQLKGLFLQHEKKLNDLISQRQNDINKFFALAGFPYDFCLQKEGEKRAKAYLVPVDHSQEKVLQPKERLSWGERNAFALVMFMFEAVSDNADLVVLDDPIAAFDEKKKFAIILRLFDNQKLSFRDRTVLMLTHDFQPIIDYVHGSFFSRYGLTTPVNASMLQNIDGAIHETPITKDDLKNTLNLTTAIVNSKKSSMPVRIVNLRKLIEMTSPEFGSSPAYEVLSSLIHGRETPQDKNGIALSADIINKGMAYISDFISDKTYADLISEINTPALITALSSNDLYHRIISARLLFERVDGALSLLRKKYPAACKFVNETNHIENDYIFQLDPRKYFSIPECYLKQIESFVHENEQKLLKKP